MQVNHVDQLHPFAGCMVRVTTRNYGYYGFVAPGREPQDCSLHLLCREGRLEDLNVLADVDKGFTIQTASGHGDRVALKTRMDNGWTFQGLSLTFEDAAASRQTAMANSLKHRKPVTA